MPSVWTFTLVNLLFVILLFVNLLFVMEDIEPSLPRYIIDYRWYWKLFIAEKSYNEEFAEKSGHKAIAKQLSDYIIHHSVLNPDNKVKKKENPPRLFL